MLTRLRTRGRREFTLRARIKPTDPKWDGSPWSQREQYVVRRGVREDQLGDVLSRWTRLGREVVRVTANQEARMSI